MSHRIHIFGASGCGTSTLGKKLADHVGCSFIDTDDYFWETTWPPYKKIRPLEIRQEMLMTELQARDSWVLSGSLFGWGDISIPLFTHAIFLYVPKEVRLERIKQREYQRYGAAIEAGGERYEEFTSFLEWASSYDEEGTIERNVFAHRKWLAALPCPTLEITGSKPLDQVHDTVLEWLSPLP